MALTRSRQLRVVVWKMITPSGLTAGRAAGSRRFTKRITVASGHGAISQVQITTRNWRERVKALKAAQDAEQGKEEMAPPKLDRP